MTVLSVPVDEKQLEFLNKSARDRGLSLEELLRQTILDYCRGAREGDFDVRAMYPHLAKVFGPAGWDDPEMDSYNALDPRRPA